jgi:hypothetical protein
VDGPDDHPADGLDDHLVDGPDGRPVDVLVQQQLFLHLHSSITPKSLLRSVPGQLRIALSIGMIQPRSLPVPSKVHRPCCKIVCVNSLQQRHTYLREPKSCYKSRRLLEAASVVDPELLLEPGPVADVM